MPRRGSRRRWTRRGWARWAEGSAGPTSTRRDDNGVAVDTCTSQVRGDRWGSEIDRSLVTTTAPERAGKDGIEDQYSDDSNDDSDWDGDGEVLSVPGLKKSGKLVRPCQD